MAIKSATPYLILNGRAKPALELYTSVLNGDVTALQRFGDVDESCPDAHRELIMHAELKFGSAVLMLSDGHAEGPVPPDGAVKVALTLDNESDLRRIFELLSVGGQVYREPLHAPFGIFSAFSDRFGVSWMLTCPSPA